MTALKVQWSEKGAKTWAGPKSWMFFLRPQDVFLRLFPVKIEQICSKKLHMLSLSLTEQAPYPKGGILMFLCLGGPGLLNSPLAQQLLYALSHIKHCSILHTMSSFLQMQRLIIIQHGTASNLAKLNCITAKWQISGSFIARSCAAFLLHAPTFAGKSGDLFLWKQPGGQLICLLGLNASMEVK